jgi:hypothetical protein
MCFNVASLTFNYEQHGWNQFHGQNLQINPTGSNYPIIFYFLSYTGYGPKHWQQKGILV